MSLQSLEQSEINDTKADFHLNLALDGIIYFYILQFYLSFIKLSVR